MTRNEYFLNFDQCRDDRGRSFDASTKRAVFVGKLDFSMTDDTLAQLFSEAGVVKSAKTQLKPDGFPRGWG
jgi:RNA recognition motif-containing protein